MGKNNAGETGLGSWRVAGPRASWQPSPSCSAAGAAQNAYRDGQQLLTCQSQVDAGLSKIQEAMALDPASAEYRIAYARVQERDINAHLGKAEAVMAQARYEEAEAAYRRVPASQPADDLAIAGLRLIDSARRHDTLYKEALALHRRRMSKARIVCLCARPGGTANRTRARTAESG